MPNRLVILCRRVTLAFLGDDMQHFRSAVVLNLAQNTHQSHYVMSVRRTEITDVQTCEDITLLLTQRRFPVVITTQNPLAFLVIHQVQFDRQLIEPPAPFIIGSTGRQIYQVLGKTAFQRVDGHVIIVQHDQQVVLVHRGVV